MSSDDASAREGIACPCPCTVPIFVSLLIASSFIGRTGNSFVKSLNYQVNYDSGGVSKMQGPTRTSTCYSFTASAPVATAPPVNVFSIDMQRQDTVSVIMSDSRALSMDACGLMPDDAPYYCLAAVANYLYALHHGYSFTYFVPHWNASTARLEGIAAVPPSDVGCYHSGTRKFRHASWCKILASWAAGARLMSSHGARTSESSLAGSHRVVYVDSDAAFMNHSESVASFLARQRSSLSGPRAGDAAVAFVYNAPWKESSYPCAGTFLFQPGPAARSVLRHWWEAPDLGKATAHPWEQDSLWEWHRTPPWPTHVAVLPEPTMGVTRPGMWVRHFASRAKSSVARGGLLRLLGTLGVDDASYAAAVRGAVGRTENLDVVRVAAEVEEVEGRR